MNRRDYLTTRSSIFMFSLIMTILMVPFSDADHILLLFFTAAMTIIWSFTFRFFLNPKIIPLSVFFNLCLIAIPSSLPFLNITGDIYTVFLPLCIGLTALTSMKEDGKSIYTRPSLTGEIFFPAAIGVIAGLIGCSLYFFEERKTLSVSVVVSAVFLILLSMAVRKVTGRDLIFSSEKINTIRDIPVSDRSHFGMFLRNRLVAAAVCVLITCSTFAVRHFSQGFTVKGVFLLPVISAAIAAVCLLIFIRKIADGTFGGGFLPYETMSCIFIAEIPYALNDPILFPILLPTSVFVFIAVDIIVTGFLSAYKRRRITAHRNIHSEGLPLLMITAGFLIMAAEMFMTFLV